MAESRGLTAQQVEWLLEPVQPHRVAKADGHSHLPQQDVRAHLSRLFGFGGWDSEIKGAALVFEMPTLSVSKGKNAPDPNRWDVCYRASVRLTIKDQHGAEVAHYEDTSTGDAQNQSRLAGHDLALKSAVSTALKRAATSLGDQFGLSLYNKGSMASFVKFTLINPGATESPDTTSEVPAGDAEEGIEPDAVTGEMQMTEAEKLAARKSELWDWAKAALQGKTSDQVLTELTESARAANPPANLNVVADVERLIELWQS